jgi:hypothetical protein
MSRLAPPPESPRPYVYVAMPLTGVDHLQRNELVGIVTEVIAPVAAELDMAVLEPARMTDPTLSAALNPGDLFEQTRSWIEQASAFISVLTGEGSVGLGVEIGTAEANHIPLIVIAPESYAISRLISGIAERQILMVDSDDPRLARARLKEALTSATRRSPISGAGVELGPAERAEVETFLLAYYRFEETTDHGRLAGEELAELRAQIETLQAQLRAPRGRRRIYVEALHSIRNIAEGLAGGGLLLAVDHVLHVVGH